MSVLYLKVKSYFPYYLLVISTNIQKLVLKWFLKDKTNIVFKIFIHSFIFDLFIHSHLSYPFIHDLFCIHSLFHGNNLYFLVKWFCPTLFLGVGPDELKPVTVILAPVISIRLNLLKATIHGDDMTSVNVCIPNTIAHIFRW